LIAAFSSNLWVCGGAFFRRLRRFWNVQRLRLQLLPQRFAKEHRVMTGLVGCGGGLGGFLLGTGVSKEQTGSYTGGIIFFSALCILALLGLSKVKVRWRTTWVPPPQPAFNRTQIRGAP